MVAAAAVMMRDLVSTHNLHAFFIHRSTVLDCVGLVDAQPACYFLAGTRICINHFFVAVIALGLFGRISSLGEKKELLHFAFIPVNSDGLLFVGLVDYLHGMLAVVADQYTFLVFQVLNGRFLTRLRLHHCLECVFFDLHIGLVLCFFLR